MAKSLFEQIVSRSITSLTAEDLKGVKKIGSRAFQYCNDLKNIEIPDNVKTIGNYAFANSGITSLSIPSNIDTVSPYAFSQCQSLTSVTLPNTVRIWGYYVFSSCFYLTNAILENGITFVTNYTFLNCNSLTSVTLPDTVTSIGISSFKGCASLSDINFIPDSVNIIRETAFAGCSGLKNITIKSSVTSIGNEAFGNNSGSMNITDVYFEHSSDATISLPTAGNEGFKYGMFYVKTARNMNVYTDNETIKNYNWAKDNITATLYHLDGTAW